MTGLAELAGWTPVDFRLEPEPAIDWADFTGERFAEPFFEQTVERLLAGPPGDANGRPMLRTGLAELAALDAAPSLDPCGIILHFSRCGSTLASRLLGTLPGTLVVSEPGAVNALLRADPARVDPAVHAQVLRLLVRALGRIRFGDERHFVLKLSSWNIRRLDIIRAAFPDAPCIWIEREPAEVMASLLAGRPNWLKLEDQPALAEQLFAIPAAAIPDMAAAEFCARALRALLESARIGHVESVDYRELPDAVWTRMAPRFGIPVAGEDITRMRAESRFAAKEPRRVAFHPAPARPVDEALRRLAAAWLDPLYMGRGREVAACSN